jgi:hypothetical protein
LASFTSAGAAGAGFSGSAAAAAAADEDLFFFDDFFAPLPPELGFLAAAASAIESFEATVRPLSSKAR